MKLMLSDGPDFQKFLIPLPSGGMARVNETFFDNISDYEFSRLIDDLPSVPENNDLDVRALWVGRSDRLGYNVAYVPGMSSKFGDWFANTGKKIENFFKPTNKPANTTGHTDVIDPATGYTVSVPDPAAYQASQRSGFEKVVGAVASIFGFGPQQQQGPYPIVPQKDPMLPLYYIGAGLLAYKVLKNK